MNNYNLVQNFWCTSAGYVGLVEIGTYLISVVDKVKLPKIPVRNVLKDIAETAYLLFQCSY